VTSHGPEPLLTSDETAALLDAMRVGAGAGPTVEDAALGAPDRPLRRVLGEADRVSEDLASSMRKIMVRVASCSASASAAPTEIVPFDVLVSSIAPGSAIAAFRSREGGHGFIVVGPSLTSFVLERRLGAPVLAGGAAQMQASRGFLSAVDRRLVRAFVAATLETFSSAWCGTADGLELGDVLARSADLPPFPQFEPMLRIGVRVSPANQAADDLLVILTTSAIRAIPTPSEEAPAAPSSDERARMAGRIGAAEVTVTAVLGRARSTVRDILAIQPGDVIRLDTVPEEPIDVRVHDVAKMRAMPVVHHGNMALEIIELR